MPGSNIGLPSHEFLRSERKKVKAEIAQDREIIAKSQAEIAELRQRFADSFDGLAESQKLIRRR